MQEAVGNLSAAQAQSLLAAGRGNGQQAPISSQGAVGNLTQDQAQGLLAAGRAANPNGTSLDRAAGRMTPSGNPQPAQGAVGNLSAAQAQGLFDQGQAANPVHPATPHFNNMMNSLSSGKGMSR